MPSALMKKFVRPGTQAANPYHVASEDKRGHSGKISIRVPKSFMRAIAKIMEQREVFGWETAGDFNRWAIYYGIEHCTAKLKDPQLGAVFHQMKAAQALSETSSNIEWFKGVVSSTRKNAEQLNADGAPEIARNMINNVYRIIDAMPDNEFKDYHLRLFQSEFSAVINSVEKKLEERRQHVSLAASKQVPDENPAETEYWNDLIEQSNLERNG